jgi:hypothetical protein
MISLKTKNDLLSINNNHIIKYKKHSLYKNVWGIDYCLSLAYLAAFSGSPKRVNN